MKSEYERETDLASRYLVQGQSLPINVLISYLKDIVYNLDCNIVSSGLPDVAGTFELF
jgi:hypothetical protein